MGPALQKTQHPLILEYALSYRGLNIMIYGIFLNSGVVGSLGPSTRLQADNPIPAVKDSELCLHIAEAGKGKALAEPYTVGLGTLKPKPYSPKPKTQNPKNPKP